MYEIIAVIRLHRLQQTKEALVAAGFPAFTAVRALGRGAGAGLGNGPNPADASGSEAGASPPAAAVLPRLFPKRLISLVVPDNLVDRAVQVIIAANQTRTPGDGKIFVIPVTQARRLRSGEAGPAAIDEMTG
jgi:nitrogen regulatory protein PII 2